MSVFKNLKTSDYIVTPLTLNKLWGFVHFSGSSNDNIEIYNGTKLGSFLYNRSQSNGEYEKLIYEEINHLFYQKFTDSLDSSSLAHSLYYESSSSDRPSGSYYYYNYNDTFVRNFPTGSNEQIKVISISNKNILGEKIKEGSLVLSSSYYYITDDKKGNLYNSSSIIGNIFYSHGLLIITDQNISPYVSEDINYFLSFKNEYTIFEHTVLCEVNESEFNLSYNPSLLNNLTNPSSSLKDFVTGSEFNPYVTSLGLYNNLGDLLIVSKFSQPIPLSTKTDITFVIKWDT